MRERVSGSGRERARESGRVGERLRECESGSER